LDGQFRQGRGLISHRRLVQCRQFLCEHRKRPTVEEDVVGRQYDDVIKFVQLHKLDAQYWRFAQVERPLNIFLCQMLRRGQPIWSWQIRQVDQG